MICIKPTPFNDQSDTATACCPRFTATGWDGPTLHVMGKVFARAKGRRPNSAWFQYMTCPNCAKVYGNNPVVGLVELGTAV